MCVCVGNFPVHLCQFLNNKRQSATCTCISQVQINFRHASWTANAGVVQRSTQPRGALRLKRSELDVSLHSAGLARYSRSYYSLAFNEQHFLYYITSKVFAQERSNNFLVVFVRIGHVHGLDRSWLAWGSNDGTRYPTIRQLIPFLTTASSYFPLVQSCFYPYTLSLYNIIYTTHVQKRTKSFSIFLFGFLHR